MDSTIGKLYKSGHDENEASPIRSITDFAPKTAASWRQRIEDRTDRRTGCWLWTGSPGPGGYAVCKINGFNVGVPRVAYILLHGDIQPGLVVRHICPGGGNRLCVNPEHLEVSTREADTRDTRGSERGTKGLAPDKLRKTGSSENGPSQVSSVAHFSPKTAASWRERLEDKTERSTGCWLWTGKPTADGYATCWIERKLRTGVHRIAYILFKGEIPPGFIVRHTCPGGGNRLCVNPDHLELGTRGDNNRDTVRSGRHRPGRGGGRKGLRLIRKWSSFVVPSAGPARDSARVEARFWRQVDKTPGCWIWKGGTTGAYGVTRIGGKQKKAHRVAWEFVHGQIPDGLVVCHDCPGGDKPLCVNPAHCFLGSQAENMRDFHRKKEAREAGTSQPCRASRVL